ncbi:MAG: hypothetical protein ACK50J_06395, partial [Planctomyces sp.]
THSVSKGITRIESESSGGRGFMVRIRRQGNQVNEYFADTRFGSTAKARKAAKERYAELSETLGPAAVAQKGLVTSRNTSGMVGVHLIHEFNARYPDSEYWAYCASWRNADGTRSKVSFSLNRFGKRGACDRALLARKFEIVDREQIEQLYAKQKVAKQRRRVALRKPK